MFRDVSTRAKALVAAGLGHLQYVISVSDTHSRRNAGIGTDGAMAGLAEVITIAGVAGAAVEVTLACRAVGSPVASHVGVAGPRFSSSSRAV